MKQHDPLNQLHHGALRRGQRLAAITGLALALAALAPAFAATAPGEAAKIYLRDRVLDTSQPPPQVPGALAMEPTEAPALYMIQFAGPIQQKWLDRVDELGVERIAYLANNAYLVWADGEAVAALEAQVAAGGSLRWIGPYHPAYRLHPGLAPGAAGSVKVTVQLVDHPGVEASIQAIEAKAGEILRPSWRVGPYLNLRVVVPAAELAAIARLPDVVNVEPYEVPVPGGERQCQIVADQLNATGDQPAGPGYFAWLTALGFGPTFDFTVDVADTGIDRGDTAAANLHDDFEDGAGTSRVTYVQRVTGTTIDTTAAANRDTGGHGTVDLSIVGGRNTGTGSAAEDGDAYNYGLGVAPFTRLGSSRIFAPGFTYPDFTEMLNSAYSQGARITSNSWGASAGASDYDSTSQEYDALVRDARPAGASDGGEEGNQEMVVVFLAGNNGPGGSSLWSRGSTAKNTLVAGASENFEQGGTDGCGETNADADDARDVAGFSSRGPTTDNRVKPDLMAPGTHIIGATSQDAGYVGTSVCDQYYPAAQTLYARSSGTSHSTPAVAGAAALVRQWFLNQGRPAPSPAMTKAFLMNSATWMTGNGANDTLPSNNQGMGRMNLERAFDTTPRLLVDQVRTFDDTGDTFTLSGTVSTAAEPFRVTLAWTDAPGNTIGNAWVNDLDLEVVLDDGSGPTTYLGNVFNQDVSQTGGAADGRNNVESVWLPAGTTGDFTITVRAANIADDGVPNYGDGTDQDFALVVYNGELPPRTPADIVLVLDRSGSMGDPVPGDTEPKIDLLKDAAELFIRTWLPYSIATDRMAVVYFESSVDAWPATPPTLQSFQPNAQAIIDHIRAQTDGGWTSLGGGLQTAINALATSANRKHIIVFTNGMQNTSPMVTSTATPGQHDIRAAAVGSVVDGVTVEWDSGVAGNPGVTLGSLGMRIHTIGTGVSGVSWQDLLEDIASQTLGEHHFTDEPDEDLELFFLDDLIASLRTNTLEMVGYRRGSLTAAAGSTVETFTLNPSVKKATFLLSWKGERRPDTLGFELYKEVGGRRVRVLGRQVQIVRGDFYTLANLTFPVRAKGGLVFPAGEWEMVVRHRAESREVPYRVSLLVDDTDLKYDFAVARRDYGVGDAILLTARVTEGGVPATDLSRAEVVVRSPARGVGTFLSLATAGEQTVITGSTSRFDPDLLVTPVDEKLYTLLQDDALRLSLRPTASVVTLHDDGEADHGDRAAGDGIFSNLLRDTRLPGHYAFEFHAEGRAPLSAATFVRRQSMSTTVRIKGVDRLRTLLEVLPDPDEPTNVTLLLTPIDRFGNYLGPGYGHRIALTVPDGRLVDELEDRLDGTYAQRLVLPRGAALVEIRVLDTTFTRPVVTAAGGAVEVSPFLGVFDFDSALPVEDGTIAGVRLGRDFGLRLGAEAELGLTRSDDLAANTGDVLLATASLLVYFRDAGETFRPFVTVGAGGLFFTGFSSDEEVLVADLGLGCKARLTARSGWRLDLRRYWADDAYGTGTSESLQVTAGLTFKLP